jgi:hypothetical protein
VGSVAEKLQTGHFKKRQLELKCNGSWTIHYCFCLDNHFKRYKPELEYLETIGVPVFWGEESGYKNNVVNFIRKALEVR